MKHLQSNAEEKKGIQYMKRIISKSGKIFREIKREDDKGIDVIVEQTNENGTGVGKFVAFQVKAGESFFKPSTQLCSIKIKNHREYWDKHPIPVYGAVYVPSLKKAFVVNIKDKLHQTNNNTISFYITDPDVFDFSYDTLKTIINNEITKRPYTDIFLDFINDQNFNPLYTLIKTYSKSFESIIDEFNNSTDFVSFINNIGLKLNDERYLSDLKNNGIKEATCGMGHGTFSFCKNHLRINEKELEFYNVTYTNAKKHLQKHGK